VTTKRDKGHPNGNIEQMWDMNKITRCNSEMTHNKKSFIHTLIDHA